MPTTYQFGRDVVLSTGSSSETEDRMRPLLTAGFARMLAVAVATGRTYLAAAAELPGPVPSLPGTIARTVEVYPDAKKNKAFPLELGSGICDLTLRAESPWRICDSSIINPVSDETIWKKFSPTRYKMATYGHAPGEFVQIEGDLYKPSSGSGEVKPELPEFLVTVPSVNLDWDAKHGEAAKEFAEDLVPAAILVSSDRADFGSLIVYGPKDDFNISSSDVTLSWDNANKVKVHDGATEIRSGHKFSIMQGASKTLLVEALDPAPDVKFTLEGEPDNVNGERAVDYVHACCSVPEVERIKFNYLENSMQDGAVEIRQSYDPPFNGIENGEWIRDPQQNYPACYVVNTQAKLMVSFADKTKSARSAKISAVVKNGNHIIKALKSRIVNFKNGKSDPVEVEFEMDGALPSVITTGQDTYQWKIENINGNGTAQYVMGETGPHKTYVILDEPLSPWDSLASKNVHNPWISALDVVCSVASGASSKRDALSKVTRYLFTNCGFRYSPIAKSSYGYAPFRLQDYLDKAELLVNCMDQGVGVSILGKILGIDAECVCAEQFGFLNRCNVIGIGECVNPINPTSTIPLCFVRHCFVKFEERVYDACIGPELGTRDQNQYLNKMIDVSGNRFYQSYFYQGSTSIYDYDF